MADVRKHEYMHEYPFVCTQAGTRQLTKQEERIASAYLLDIVHTHTPVWAIVASGIGIIAGAVVGVAAYLSFIF